MVKINYCSVYITGWSFKSSAGAIRMDSNTFARHIMMTSPIIKFLK